MDKLSNTDICQQRWRNRIIWQLSLASHPVWCSGASHCCCGAFKTMNVIIIIMWVSSISHSTFLHPLPSSQPPSLPTFPSLWLIFTFTSSVLDLSFSLQGSRCWEKNEMEAKSRLTKWLTTGLHTGHLGFFFKNYQMIFLNVFYSSVFQPFPSHGTFSTLNKHSKILLTFS